MSVAHNRKNLTGMKFNRWTVTATFTTKGEGRNKRLYYLCICDCGTRRYIATYKLTSGWSKSCGCLKSEMSRKSLTKYGMYRSPERKIWQEMKQRCLSPSNKNYTRYGGRSITVCTRWGEFKNFYADMGPRPSLAHTLDRIDNDGDYEPSNCRWATIVIQANNKSDAVYVDIDGVTKPLSDWCREINIAPRWKAYQRIYRDKWDGKTAVMTP